MYLSNLFIIYFISPRVFPNRTMSSAYKSDHTFFLLIFLLNLIRLTQFHFYLDHVCRFFIYFLHPIHQVCINPLPIVSYPLILGLLVIVLLILPHISVVITVKQAYPPVVRWSFFIASFIYIGISACLHSLGIPFQYKIVLYISCNIFLILLFQFFQELEHLSFLQDFVFHCTFLVFESLYLHIYFCFCDFSISKISFRARFFFFICSLLKYFETTHIIFMSSISFFCLFSSFRCFLFISSLYS